MAEDEASTIPKDRLTYLFLHLLGHLVQVQLKDGTIYEGICGAIAKDEFAVILSGARLKASKVHSPAHKQKTKPKESLHVPTTELVSVFAPEVSFGGGKSFYDGVFLMDSDIAAQRFMGGVERELKPCDFLLDASAYASLEADMQPSGKDTSWDQFAVNKAKFGYQTTWDESLYTTRLDASRITTDMEREAARIAREIERGDHSKHADPQQPVNIHLLMERNQLLDHDYNEEELHSSVSRPEAVLRYQAKQAGGDQGPVPGKYVPPHKRGPEPAVFQPRILERPQQQVDQHHFQSAADFMNQVGEYGHASPPVTAMSALDVERHLMHHPSSLPNDGAAKISWADTVEEDEREDAAQPTSPPVPTRAPDTGDRVKMLPSEDSRRVVTDDAAKGALPDRRPMPFGSVPGPRAGMLDLDRRSPTNRTKALAGEFAKIKKDETKKTGSREQEINSLKAWSTTLGSKLRPKSPTQQSSQTPPSPAAQQFPPQGPGPVNVSQPPTPGPPTPLAPLSQPLSKAGQSPLVNASLPLQASLPRQHSGHPSAPSTPQNTQPLQLQMHHHHHQQQHHQQHQHHQHQRSQHPPGFGEMSLQSFNSPPPKRGPQPVVTISSILDANLASTMAMHDPSHEMQGDMMNTQHGAPAGDQMPHFGQGPQQHPYAGQMVGGTIMHVSPTAGRGLPAALGMPQASSDFDEDDDQSPMTPNSYTDSQSAEGRSLNPNAKEWKPSPSGSGRKGGRKSSPQRSRGAGQQNDGWPPMRLLRETSVSSLMSQALMQRLTMSEGVAAFIGGDRSYTHLWVKPPPDQKDFVYYVDLESIEDETDAVHQPPGGTGEDGTPRPTSARHSLSREYRTGLPLAAPAAQYSRGGPSAGTPAMPVTSPPVSYGPTGGFAPPYQNSSFNGPGMAAGYPQSAAVPPSSPSPAQPLPLTLPRGVPSLSQGNPQMGYSQHMMVDISPGSQGGMPASMQQGPHGGHQQQGQYAQAPNMPPHVGAGMHGLSMHPQQHQQRAGPSGQYYAPTAKGLQAAASPVSAQAWQQTPPQPQALPSMYGYQDAQGAVAQTAMGPSGMVQLQGGPQHAHHHHHHHHHMNQGIHTMPMSQMHPHAHMHASQMHLHQQTPPSPQQHTPLSSPMPPQPQKLMVGKKGGGPGMPPSPSLMGGGLSLPRGTTPPQSPSQDMGYMSLAPGFLPTVQIDDPLKLQRGTSNSSSGMDTIRIAQRATTQRYAPPSHRLSDQQSMASSVTSAGTGPPYMGLGGQPMNAGKGGGYKGGGGGQRGQTQHHQHQQHQHQHQHQQQHQQTSPHQHHHQTPRRLTTEDTHGKTQAAGMPYNPHTAAMMGQMAPHAQVMSASGMQPPPPPPPQQQQHQHQQHPTSPHQQQQHHHPQQHQPRGSFDSGGGARGGGKNFKGRQRGPKLDNL